MFVVRRIKSYQNEEMNHNEGMKEAARKREKLMLKHELTLLSTQALPITLLRRYSGAAVVDSVGTTQNVEAAT